MQSNEITKEVMPSLQSTVESTSDGIWLINHPNSRRIYAVQCGLDVTLFTLKYFKVDYSLSRVSMGLPLSDKGISLADIQQILIVYGLQADARKKITIKQIASYLNGEYIAIIPLSTAKGINHYYIGMMDDKGIVQLVNVSKGVMPLVSQLPQDNERREKRFVDAGGIVLFVKKNKSKTISISQAIKSTPDKIDLGEFMVDGPNSSDLIDASFNLINTSDSPVMVSSVQTSCGCTKLAWEGGIIKAGEKKEVKFSVIPGAWGRGEQKKIARVSFVDGSTIDVPIHGTGQTPVERQRIELSQYSANIEIDEEAKDTFRVRLARLSSYVRPIQEIKMTSDVSWIEPELTDLEKNENHEGAELHAKLSVQKIRSLMSESSDNKLRGIIHISGNKEIEPVDMNIEVFQRDFYRLSQPLIVLSKNATGITTIQIIPEKENDTITIQELKSEVEFIVTKIDNNDGVQSISIKLDSTKNIKSGYYTVTAKLKNSKGVQNLAHLTINITDGNF
ncbi:MAG: DUF1573 domain-containing protein [Planctomycetaceae bacterium]|nr:DUF1573 domain-containing protein [Planctomycetaceae bacterium]